MAEIRPGLMQDHGREVYTPFLARRGVEGPLHVIEGPNGINHLRGMEIRIPWKTVRLRGSRREHDQEVQRSDPHAIGHPLHDRAGQAAQDRPSQGCLDRGGRHSNHI